jgi:hypothetical protein
MPSLEPQARAAQESVRSLERTLTDSRSRWDDATRQAFDQRHVDSVVASGRRAADELAVLARELAAALASLPMELG